MNDHPSGPDAPSPHERPVEPDAETLADFDDVERMTRAFVHWAKFGLLVGVPFWLVFLLVFPALGLGVSASFASASLVAVLATVFAERLWMRHVPGVRAADAADAATPGVRRVRRPMSAARAVLLTLLAVAVGAYVIFIVVTIVRGG